MESADVMNESGSSFRRRRNAKMLELKRQFDSLEVRLNKAIEKLKHVVRLISIKGKRECIWIRLLGIRQSSIEAKARMGLGGAAATAELRELDGSLLRDLEAAEKQLAENLTELNDTVVQLENEEPSVIADSLISDIDTAIRLFGDGYNEFGQVSEKVLNLETGNGELREQVKNLEVELAKERETVKMLESRIEDIRKRLTSVGVRNFEDLK